MLLAYFKLKAELERALVMWRVVSVTCHITPLYLKFASPTYLSLYSFSNPNYHPL